MTQNRDDEPDAYRLDAQLMSDLWIFRAAARFGSITAAARHLNVTQGAVSQRVLRLEARLGAALFVRQKGRIALTDAGTALMAAMTDVAATLNDALSRINRQKGGALVVSCLPSLATEWLVPNLESFYAEHPGIEIFVRSELLPSTAERLEDEGIDVAIDYSPDSTSGLHELASLQEVLFPVCSRAYREQLDARAQAPDEPVVILHDDVPWIGGVPGDEWAAWRDAVDRRWPEGPRTERHFNLAHLAYHAAMCDRGIAMGRSVVVNRLMTRGELILALDVPPVAGPTFRVLTHRPGNAHSPAKRFAAWWAKAMRETQLQTLSLLTTTAE
ncbi:MAG: LysR family transcriptional regulator [Sphingomonadales bacterium]|nr:MAG: LysR family transcriptional regulator [Sphingomonadales bacterium]